MNRLSKEKSVYLKQHSQNPVDWYPWGAVAFEVARQRNCPLLISIGYSTCHWCHVMEHESFEDQEVARLLNESFVSIKIDREELPDVDSYFMQALLQFAGRGGWPLNMFVTPELKPFYGGTYFPKSTFVQLLSQIKKIWADEPAKVIEQAQAFTDHLSSADSVLKVQLEAKSLKENIQIRRQALDQLAESELQRFDPVWGGFGSAPKFPRSHELSSLIRARKNFRDPASCRKLDYAISHTLKCMAYGGLRDHLEGGFHRYSTDERWLVPHFEKMLYDQALLMTSYSESWVLYKDRFAVEIVGELLDFLNKKMKSDNGLFAAAWDADSENVEGKFYVFTYDEVKKILVDLPAEELECFCKIHTIEEAGNWESQNVLAAPLDVSSEELFSTKNKSYRSRLLEYRNKRIAPIRDDKAIVAWNGWMISALFKASINLSGADIELSQKLKQTAKEALDNLLARVKKADQVFEIPRIFYKEEAQGRAYLEDGVAVVEALQYGALATGESKYWTEASLLLKQIQEDFITPNFAIRSSVSDLELDKNLGHALAYKVDEQDGANPAPLSLWIPALIRQSLYESSTDSLNLALKMLESFKMLLTKHPVALTYMLAELSVLEAVKCSVPKAKYAPFLSDLAKEGYLAGEVLCVASQEESFELCDFEKCFLKANNSNQVFDELTNRSANRPTGQ